MKSPWRRRMRTGDRYLTHASRHETTLRGLQFLLSLARGATLLISVLFSQHHVRLTIHAVYFLGQPQLWAGANHKSMTKWE